MKSQISEFKHCWKYFDAQLNKTYNKNIVFFPPHFNVDIILLQIVNFSTEMESFIKFQHIHHTVQCQH